DSNVAVQSLHLRLGAGQIGLINALAQDGGILRIRPVPLGAVSTVADDKHDHRNHGQDGKKHSLIATYKLDHDDSRNVGLRILTVPPGEFPPHRPDLKWPALHLLAVAVFNRAS